MAGLLFIASNRIGDAVLATGALRHACALAPEGPVTIACGPLPAPLFRATPRLKALHLVEKQRGDAHWFALWRALRGERYDLAVDLRGTLLTYALAAKRRIVHRRPPELRHKVEELSALMGASQALAPRLDLDEQARAAAACAAPGAGPILALGPGANFIGKRWPPDRFAALARRLAAGAGPRSGARIVLLGGGEDRAIADEIVASLDADGVRAVDLAGKLDLPACAALLERTTLFVGNDSGLMHIAAASGAPTLGLFGPSNERVYGPYGARARALRGRAYEDIMAEGYMPHITRTLMEDISVDAAEAAAQDLLRAGGVT
jgi:lipopolysaccharide export system permease protein